MNLSEINFFFLKKKKSRAKPMFLLEKQMSDLLAPENEKPKNYTFQYQSLA